MKRSAIEIVERRILGLRCFMEIGDGGAHRGGQAGDGSIPLLDYRFYRIVLCELSRDKFRREIRNITDDDHRTSCLKEQKKRSERLFENLEWRPREQIFRAGPNRRNIKIGVFREFGQALPEVYDLRAGAR